MKQPEAIRDEIGGTPLAPESPARAPGWRRIPFAGARVGAAPANDPQRRSDTRIHADLRLELTSIDASRDGATGQVFFATSADERTRNLSRRGMCLRCERPPAIGTRVLLQLRLPGESSVDVIGRTRWTRVEFEPGEYGSRAFALVGIEILGGAPRSLARYDRALGRLLALEEDPNSPVASVGGHR